MRAPGEDSDIDQEGGAGSKRRRTADEDFTVSTSAPSRREKRKLRKKPVQSTWDGETAEPLKLPPGFEEWIEREGWKAPYNPKFDHASYPPISTRRYANPHFHEMRGWELS